MTRPDETPPDPAGLPDPAPGAAGNEREPVDLPDPGPDRAGQATPDTREPAETPGDPPEPAEEFLVASVTDVRRAPRYHVFILLGAALLGLAGLVWALVVPGTGENEGAATVFTALTGAFLGALLGAVVAALIDRR